ncbi:hypothetical protein GTU79_22540 [Sodalis ligni]|nr:hypothetical protein GTU79_22540 [Sodalis ligni]
MKILYRYFTLLLYCCLFYSNANDFGFIISLIFYFINGTFNFPEPQLERAIIFGLITGIAVWFGILIFKLLDILKIRHLDSNKMILAIT